MERESYKHNFLTKFLEKNEEEVVVSKTPRVGGALSSKIPLAKTLTDVRNLAEQTTTQPA